MMAIEPRVINPGQVEKIFRLVAEGKVNIPNDDIILLFDIELR